MHATTLPRSSDIGYREPAKECHALTRLSWIIPALAALKLGVTLALSGRYGFHRDELYYLAAGRHLALGYVDFPPIAPLLARFDELVFGTSLIGLRLLPALAGALIVVLTGLIARE